MATAEQIEARIAELEALKGSGVVRVAYDGRSFEYRSLADIERAIDLLRDDLAALTAPAGVSTGRSRVFLSYQRGKGL